MSEKLNDILLAVDVGYDLTNVADGFVRAFNQSGSYMIETYKIREPNEDEIKKAKVYSESIRKAKGCWVVTKKMFDGSTIEKRLFVLVPEKTQKVPEHILKLRPKRKLEKIEVGEKDGVDNN